jgi:ABC-type branched-subunit amino acid transport system substrate-binding protein
MLNSFTARPSGKRVCPVRGIANSSRHIKRNSNRAPAVQSANSYAGCQIFAEAVRQAGTTDSEKLREALLTLKTKTILGDFVVDQRGFKTGQKAATIQWQDGKQGVVWPNGLGASPRFPTPNWASR